MIKRRLGVTLAVLTLTAGGLGVSGCGDSSTPATSTPTGTTATTDTTVAVDNGVASLTGDEILQRASDAVSHTDSVTIKGQASEGGQDISLNLAIAKNAADGTVTIKGVDVRLRLVNDTVYMQAPKEFWSALSSQGAALGSLLADKWFAIPADGSVGAGNFSSLSGFTSKDALFTSLLTNKTNVTLKGTGDVNGQPVVFLEDDKNVTLAIATTGEPYPVQIKGSGGATTSAMNFTNWNGPVNAVIPADVIDIGKFVQAGGTGSASTGSTTST